MTGKDFRRWRRSEEITQQRVADMCNLDKSTVSRWENDLVVLSDEKYNNVISFIDYIMNKSKHER